MIDPAESASLRVASLLPCATEIVCALGLEERLVARSHECDFPPSVAHLPIVTEPKFDMGGSSVGLDQLIKTLVREGLSIYRVDADRLKALRPDVVLTQSQCEVCAVTDRDIEAALYLWVDNHPDLVSLAPVSLAQVWNEIRRVGAALGVPERADALIVRLRARSEAIAEKAQAVRERPTVAVVEWLDPLMAAGNWMPELVKLAGGLNCFGMAGQHSPWLSWEQLPERDPDVICIIPCGFEISRTKKELNALTSRPGWRSLRAVLHRRVYVADGNAYFNRPGPRLVESLEILAEIFHPTVFRFGHAGVGWKRVV